MDPNRTVSLVISSKPSESEEGVHPLLIKSSSSATWKYTAEGDLSPKGKGLLSPLLAFRPITNI